MKANHLMQSNVTAIVVLFVVLLFSGSVVRINEAHLSNLPHDVEQMRAASAIDVVSQPLRQFQGTFAEKMKTVYHVGREIGHPETLQAILLQETNGGRSAAVGNLTSPVGKRSYGLMQVQVVAARSVLQRYPTVLERYFPGRTVSSLFDEEIIALLLTNDEANIRIAAHHFNLYLKLSNGDWDKAVAAYNVGIGGVENVAIPAEYPYVVEIKTKIEEIVRPFNQKHRLRLS